jgi:hypothetical protein
VLEYTVTDTPLQVPWNLICHICWGETLVHAFVL